MKSSKKGGFGPPILGGMETQISDMHFQIAPSILLVLEEFRSAISESKRRKKKTGDRRRIVVQPKYQPTTMSGGLTVSKLSENIYIN